MTITEFLRAVRKLVKDEVRFSIVNGCLIRSEDPIYGDPLEVVRELVDSELELIGHDEECLENAADHAIDTPLRRRLLKACGLGGAK